MMTIRMKWVSVSASVLLFSLFAVGCGSGASTGGLDFPTRTIEIISDGGPGGGSDVFARVVGRELSDIFGVNVNIVNNPGASGGNARQGLMSRPADGHAIMTISTSHPIYQADGKIPDPENYVPLVMMAEDLYAIQTNKNSPYADFDHLISEAKAEPGSISIGGTASRGLDELTVRRIEGAAGIELNYVPFNDAGEMHAALLGGHIDLLLEEVGPTLELLKQGELEMSIVLANDRLEDFPDVPTSVEKGVPVTDGRQRGFMIRSGTPQEIIDMYADALIEVTKRDEWKKYTVDNFLHLKPSFMGPADFAKFLDETVASYKAIFEELDKQ